MGLKVQETPDLQKHGCTGWTRVANPTMVPSPKEVVSSFGTSKSVSFSLPAGRKSQDLLELSPPCIPELKWGIPYGQDVADRMSVARALSIQRQFISRGSSLLRLD